MPDSYRQNASSQLRVLFCLGVSQPFFDTSSSDRPRIVQAFKDAFDDLAGRFGVTVLGTMDDDDLVVGPATEFPWTAYILADVPDLETVKAITTVVRDFEIGDERLWRYVKVEARVGRPLFFGTA